MLTAQKAKRLTGTFHKIAAQQTEVLNMLTAQRTKKIVNSYEWVRTRKHKKECQKRLKMIFKDIKTAAKEGQTYQIIYFYDPISVKDLEKTFTDLGYKFEWSSDYLAWKISWEEEK